MTTVDPPSGEPRSPLVAALLVVAFVAGCTTPAALNGSADDETLTVTVQRELDDRLNPAPSAAVIVSKEVRPEPGTDGMQVAVTMVEVARASTGPLGDVTFDLPAGEYHVATDLGNASVGTSVSLIEARAVAFTFGADGNTYWRVRGHSWLDESDDSVAIQILVIARDVCEGDERGYTCQAEFQPATIELEPLDRNGESLRLDVGAEEGPQIDLPIGIYSVVVTTGDQRLEGRFLAVCDSRLEARLDRGIIVGCYSYA